MNDYTKQANNFANKFGVKLSVIGEPEYRKYFANDKKQRFVFKLRLTRNKKQYTFTFGQSISEGSNKPNLYQCLTCLTKYDPYSFEDFCSEYGYDNDSRSAEKVYNAVCKEYAAVERLFGDCLDELSEIQ